MKRKLIVIAVVLWAVGVVYLLCYPPFIGGPLNSGAYVSIPYAFLDSSILNPPGGPIEVDTQRLLLMVLAWSFVPGGMIGYARFC